MKTTRLNAMARWPGAQLNEIIISCLHRAGCYRIPLVRPTRHIMFAQRLCRTCRSRCQSVILAASYRSEAWPVLLHPAAVMCPMRELSTKQSLACQGCQVVVDFTCASKKHAIRTRICGRCIRLLVHHPHQARGRSRTPCTMPSFGATSSPCRSKAIIWQRISFARTSSLAIWQECEGCQVFDGFWRVWSGVEAKLGHPDCTGNCGWSFQSPLGPHQCKAAPAAAQS